jgi:hypothetical protein
MIRLQNPLASEFNSLPFILVLFFIFFRQNSHSQYNLPKSEVLVKNNVKAIHVTKTNLRVIDGDNKDVTERNFDRSTTLLTSYFLNGSGRIDSVFQYANDPKIYTKEVYCFGSNGQLLEINTIDDKGDVKKRTLLEEAPNNEFLFRAWDHGVVYHELKINSDSIIYEVNTIHSFNPVKRYSKTYYNLEIDSHSEILFEGHNEVMSETYQWLSNSGVPYRFIYTKNSSARRNEKQKSERREFEVAQDGSVMSENKGLFTDPFHSYNYFDRYERFKGIQHPYANLLRSDSLIYEREGSEMIKFDGTHMDYIYSMSYEKFN